MLVLALAGLLFTAQPFTRAVDEIGQRTGLGGALVGGVLLGAMTSLPGLITSATAAALDRPSFAVSNALGGIAVQTTFIVVADLFHRRANLEYAAASLTNLFQGTLLLALLSLVMMARASPELTLGPAHPVTYLLGLVYAGGLYLARDSARRPMWTPTQVESSERADERRPAVGRTRVLGLLGRFLLLGGVVASCGFALAHAGLALSHHTGSSETFVGSVLTATASSMPELVTAVVAVRAGQVTLAVANIVGGNSFDVLIVGVSDLFFSGSIYHASEPATSFVVAETMLLTAILLAGMLRRDREGIGFEGFAIVGVYLACAMVVALGY